MPYYTVVSCSTNSYAIDKKGWGGDYRHTWRNVTAQEMVIWDGIIALNINSNPGKSWMPSKENRYNPIINDTMSCRHFLNIKACYKQNAWSEEKVSQFVTQIDVDIFHI